MGCLGNAQVDGGAGIDIYGNWSDTQITYFFDQNENGLLEQGEEITLAEFQASGINAFYEIADGQRGINASTSTATSYDDYLNNHDAGHLNVGSAELAATTHMSERGAGWFDYNPGYFVELQDLSSERNADVGLGTSTLTNVEVVYLEAEGALYDLATGQLHYFNGT